MLSAAEVGVGGVLASSVTTLPASVSPPVPMFQRMQGRHWVQRQPRVTGVHLLLSVSAPRPLHMPCGSLLSPPPCHPLALCPLLPSSHLTFARDVPSLVPTNALQPPHLAEPEDFPSAGSPTPLGPSLSPLTPCLAASSAGSGWLKRQRG